MPRRHSGNENQVFQIVEADLPQIQGPAPQPGVDLANAYLVSPSRLQDGSSSASYYLRKATEAFLVIPARQAEGFAYLSKLLHAYKNALDQFPQDNPDATQERQTLQRYDAVITDFERRITGGEQVPQQDIVNLCNSISATGGAADLNQQITAQVAILGGDIDGSEGAGDENPDHIDSQPARLAQNRNATNIYLNQAEASILTLARVKLAFSEAIGNKFQGVATPILKKVKVGGQKVGQLAGFRIGKEKVTFTNDAYNALMQKAATDPNTRNLTAEQLRQQFLTRVLNENNPGVTDNRKYRARRPRHKEHKLSIDVNAVNFAVAVAPPPPGGGVDRAPLMGDSAILDALLPPISPENKQHILAKIAELSANHPTQLPVERLVQAIMEFIPQAQPELVRDQVNVLQSGRGRIVPIAPVAPAPVLRVRVEEPLRRIPPEARIQTLKQVLQEEMGLPESMTAENFRDLVSPITRELRKPLGTVVGEGQGQVSLDAVKAAIRRQQEAAPVIPPVAAVQPKAQPQPKVQPQPIPAAEHAPEPKIPAAPPKQPTDATYASFAQVTKQPAPTKTSPAPGGVPPVEGKKTRPPLPPRKKLQTAPSPTRPLQHLPAPRLESVLEALGINTGEEKQNFLEAINNRRAGLATPMPPVRLATTVGELPDIPTTQVAFVLTLLNEMKDPKASFKGNSRNLTPHMNKYTQMVEGVIKTAQENEARAAREATRPIAPTKTVPVAGSKKNPVPLEQLQFKRPQPQRTPSTEPKSPPLWKPKSLLLPNPKQSAIDQLAAQCPTVKQVLESAVSAFTKDPAKVNSTAEVLGYDKDTFLQMRVGNYPGQVSVGILAKACAQVQVGQTQQPVDETKADKLARSLEALFDKTIKALQPQSPRL